MKIPINPLRLVPLVSALFSGWGRTLRMQKHGDLESVLEMNKNGKPSIVALWHGELFPLLAEVGRHDCKLVIIVSQSKDGEFIARFLEHNGHATVRGSSSRGGVKALLQAKHMILKEKILGAVTVDGPRGPRHKSKDGIIFLAQKIGAQIIPIRAVASHKKEFNSWDRFMVPYPFSTCHIYVGDPMDVTTEKLDKDVLKRERERLEERLHALVSNQQGTP